MKLNVKKIFITLCTIFLISFNSVYARSLLSEIQGTTYITFDTELVSTGVQLTWNNDFGGYWEIPDSLYSTIRPEQRNQIAGACETMATTKINL